MKVRAFLFLLLLAGAMPAVTLAPTPALAWEWQGHRLGGWVADRLLAGTKAEARVREILGRDLAGKGLADVADWPDCVRSLRKLGDRFVWFNVSWSEAVIPPPKEMPQPTTLDIIPVRRITSRP